MLLVLDDPDLLHKLTVGLEQVGYEVVIGATSFAARAKLERHDFDAIAATWDPDERGPGEIIYEWVLAHKFELIGHFVFIGEARTERFRQLVTERTPMLPADDVASVVDKIKVVAATKERARTGPGIILEADESPELLLVEPDDSQRQFIRGLLADVGFSVIEAASDAYAIEALEDNDIGVVLATWNHAAGSVSPLYAWIENNRPALFDRTVFMTGKSLAKLRGVAERATCIAKGQDSKALLSLLIVAARARRPEDSV